jgi:hypothetical protein
MENFTVYVMQSAHTDIGYTHPQEQIALMYLEHYDRVLNLCQRYEHAPPAQRFKWTCETFWQVRHYLAQRPEREADFLRYARNGQIELMAGYLHFTDLIDPDAYRRSLRQSVDFCRAHDLPLRCLLHADINGWPWAIADILAEFGIPYFMSHVHVDSGTDPLGARGSVHYHWTLEWRDALRPDVPVRLPQAFWWEGPRGGRVLHFLNEHYHLGNALGLSSNHPFGADKTRYFLETDRLTADAIYAVAKREVPRYVDRLRRDGYPYESLLIGTGGYYVDNAPPDDRWCQIVERWNSEHSEIQLRTATPGEWLDHLMTLDQGTWPRYRVAWPDHWAHGLGSLTARIAQARRTQRRRVDAVRLVEHSRSSAAVQALDVALEQERLALEHTFDAWSTTAWPAATANFFQQAAKELTFHRAEMYMDEAVGAALRASTAPAPDGQPRLHVHVEDAAVGTTRTVHFDGGDTRLDPESQELQAEDGGRFAIQRDRHDLPQFVASPSLAHRGLNAFRLVSASRQERRHGGEIEGSLTLESSAWHLTVDPASGCLVSLRSRSSRTEWVGTGHVYGFGQLVHETVLHPLGRAATSNVARLIALDSAGGAMRARWIDSPVFERTTPTRVELVGTTRGAVFDSIAFAVSSERLGGAAVSWRAYHAVPIVELAIEWDKQWCELPEAAYVAFPFSGEAIDLELETGGGFFRPGSHADGGQLSGTCSSYYTVQRAAAIASRGGERVAWLPVDAPLVMPNDIDYNRWETGPYTWNGFLASMPVNHYWHTNFPISQRGRLQLRYRWVRLPAEEAIDTAIQAALPADALGWR